MPSFPSLPFPSPSSCCLSVAAALVTNVPDVGQALCNPCIFQGSCEEEQQGCESAGKGREPKPCPQIQTASHKFHPCSTHSSPLSFRCSQHVFHDTPEQDLTDCEANNLYFSAESRMGWNKSPLFSRQSVDLMAAVSS